MITYREFNSITDEEIKQILTDIFSPIKFGEIIRKNNEIDVEIFIMESAPEYCDVLWLYPDTIETREFDISREELLKYEKFLLAKGMDERFKDNPYLEG